MSSGNRRLRINTQERAVSSDINRLQQFANQDEAELFRFLMNVRTDEDDPGVSVEDASLGTPLGFEIANGLLVKPQAGTLSLFVDAGVAYAMSPDAIADDSNYKYVRDAGVAGVGLLLMTVNASGSTRIDVIECRPNPVELVVADSRDIFNPATGLFSATSVTKELSARLEYRVRAGTPGSGMPALASGWCPLAVASVPDGTATNDTITFWDVRPLVGDRARAPMATMVATRLLEADWSYERVDASNVNFRGTASGIVKGRRVGGPLENGVPGTGVAFVNVMDPVNQDTGTIAEPLTANTCVFLYLATPFGLPRWARYTDGPTGRIPRGSRGIPMSSLTTPNYDGSPAAELVLPASTGLGATTTPDAICVGMAVASSTGVINDEGFCANRVVTGVTAIAGAYNVLDSASCDFHVTDAIWPPNAKALVASFQVQATIGASPGQAEIINEVYLSGDDTMAGIRALLYGTRQHLVNPAGAPANKIARTGLMRLPLPRFANDLPAALSSPRLVQLKVGSGGTLASIFMHVFGYEL